VKKPRLIMIQEANYLTSNTVIEIIWYENLIYQARWGGVRVQEREIRREDFIWKFCS
jgi:hypothetical protein